MSYQAQFPAVIPPPFFMQEALGMGGPADWGSPGQDHDGADDYPGLLLSIRIGKLGNTMSTDIRFNNKFTYNFNSFRRLLDGRHCGVN